MLQNGAKSNHFLENAEFKTRQENKEITISKLKQFFEEACK